MKRLFYIIIACFIVFSLLFQMTGASAQTRTYSISGRVTDENETGIANVEVMAVQIFYKTMLPIIMGNSTTKLNEPINSSGADQNFYTVLTDSDGYYSFDSLPTGNYKLTVFKEGLDFDPLSYSVSSSLDDGPYDFQTINIPLIYAPNAYNLSEETLDQLISVSSDGITYTFPSGIGELDAVNIGDIIIGGVSTLTPEGFLREVTSIEVHESNLLFITEQATLEEAFQSLSINEVIELTPSNIEEITNVPGIELISSPTLRGFGDYDYAMNDAVIYDADGDTSTTDDQVVANGLFSLDPKVEIHVRIENCLLHEFYGSVSMSVQTGYTVSSSFNFNFDFIEAKLMPTVPLGAVQAGPVTIVPTLDLVAGLSGSVVKGVSYSISNTSQFTAGIWFVDGKTHDISNYKSNFSFQPPTFTKGVSFTASIGPKVSAKLYGAFGFYVKAGYAGKLDIQPELDPWLTLKAGFEVSTGFSISEPIFHTEILSLEILSIYKWWLLYSLSTSSNTVPDPPSNPSPSDGSDNQLLITLLSWVGSDPDGDLLVYDVYFNAENLYPTTKVADHQSTAELVVGPLQENTAYYWKVVAFDQHGTSIASPVWRFTTGGTIEPGAFTKISPADGATNQSTSLTLDWSDSAGATNYSYCYDDSDDNSCSSWVNTGTTSQATITGLNTNTQYFWQVKATNEAGDSYADGSTISFWTFTTGDNSVIPGEMVYVPAGEFQMGCDPDHNGGYSCYSRELPLHTVYLDAYYIDTTEVTNAQYAQCVAAGACDIPRFNYSAMRDPYYDNPAYANYPVIHVDWYDAANYCNWAGKRLPTEAEWEKAARGTTVRAYPWGDEDPNCNLVNGNWCGVDTNEVGSYPDGSSQYGALDMSGNVLEWVADWHDNDFYSTSPFVNPTGPASGDYKVLRGGSFDHVWEGLLVVTRFYDSPVFIDYIIGFRCAAGAP